LFVVSVLVVEVEGVLVAVVELPEVLGVVVLAGAVVLLAAVVVLEGVVVPDVAVLVPEVAVGLLIVDGVVEVVVPDVGEAVVVPEPLVPDEVVDVVSADVFIPPVRLLFVDVPVEAASDDSVVVPDPPV
jgi:hypothetical protein